MNMNEHISSKDNRIFKLCSHLLKKKYRDREGKFLIEGENLVFEALLLNSKLDLIILSEDYKGLENIKKNRYNDILIYTMDSKLFRKISSTEESQGILAVAKKPEYDICKLKSLIGEGNVVVLDKLQDPGNIGTIIRTAEGAGYKCLISIKGTADIYSPKVVRAAAGSLLRLPIFFISSEEELLKLSYDLGKKTAVTCFENAIYYYEEDLSKNIALIIGNEGNGCSDFLIENSDIKLKIPMDGKLESLNASVAAGILMYESMRK